MAKVKLFTTILKSKARNIFYLILMISVWIIYKTCNSFNGEDFNDININNNIIAFNINQFAVKNRSQLIGNLFGNVSVTKFRNGFTDANNQSYIDYVRANWLFQASLNKSSTVDLLHKEEHDFSEVGQSMLITRLLKQKTHGVFVESGAGDGVSFSNTLYLERHFKWTGLLVEPNPHFFRKLLSSSNRTTAVASPVCLSNTDQSQNNVSFIDNAYWSKIKGSNHSENQYNRRIKPHKVIQVQCFPLGVLLKSLNITHVDYLSLDTEGSEIGILKTIPFSKIFIDVIGVEYRVSIGTPVAPFIDFEGTARKLQATREFFNSLKLYEEVGILPTVGSNTKDQEDYGLDVFFRRKKVV